MIFLEFNYLDKPYKEGFIFKLRWDIRCDIWHGSYTPWVMFDAPVWDGTIYRLFVNQSVMSKLCPIANHFYLANSYVESVKDGLLPENYYRNITLRLTNNVSNQEMMDYIERERYKTALGIKDEH